MASYDRPGPAPIAPTISEIHSEIADTVYLNGKRYLTLQHLLKSRYTPNPTIGNIGSFGRDDVSRWSILGNRLYLISVSGWSIEQERPIWDVATGGATAPVIADWVSGDLVLYNGQFFGDAVAGPGYEFETVVVVEAGHVKTVRLAKRHSLPEPHIQTMPRLPIERLLIPESALDLLRAANLTRIGDVIRLTELDLIELVGLSVQDVRAIAETLSIGGYVLGTPLPGWPPKPPGKAY